MKGKTIIYLLAGTILILLSYCAKVGSPSGGKIDRDPPVVESSTPDNYSIQYTGKQIEITFDEYIQLKEVNQKLIVSPPLEKRPEIRLKGKSLLVEFEDELKENTTYTFNFFDAIVDNNESNPLEDYEFVFSTGNSLDSLSITGKVIKAFDLQSERDVFIIIHENLEDSAFSKLTPLYVSKADEKGNFRINNLRAGSFRLYALKDGNMNYRYDQPGELVAFMDTLLVLFPELTAQADTFRADTTGGRFAPATIRNIELYLFQTKRAEQYLKNHERKQANHLLFIFNEPITGTILLEPVDFTPQEDWFLREDYINGDSVSYWITDTAVINTELLKVALTFSRKDSAGLLKGTTDTLTLRYIEPARSRARRQETIEDPVTAPKLMITTNVVRGRAFDLNRSITIQCSAPVGSVDTSRISITETEDTLMIPQEYRFYSDSLGQRKFRLAREWNENTLYELAILPGAFTDIYGANHDTIRIRFKTQSLDYYGVIVLNLTNVDARLVMQLLTGNNEILNERPVTSDILIEYRYLYPGKYRLKAIVDRNGNGKWDTGDIPEKRQPEEVIFYREDIQVRSNWDVEIDWNIIPRQSGQMPEP